MKYTKIIREYFIQNKGIVFDISYELNKHFSMVPYRTFCKILSRLEEQGNLKEYSKGVYIINSNDLAEDSIIVFYANDYAGVVVGYHMYKKMESPKKIKS